MLYYLMSQIALVLGFLLFATVAHADPSRSIAGFLHSCSEAAGFNEIQDLLKEYDMGELKLVPSSTGSSLQFKNVPKDCMAMLKPDVRDKGHYLHVSFNSQDPSDHPMFRNYSDAYTRGNRAQREWISHFREHLRAFRGNRRGLSFPDNVRGRDGFKRCLQFHKSLADLGDDPSSDLQASYDRFQQAYQRNFSYRVATDYFDDEGDHQEIKTYRTTSGAGQCSQLVDLNLQSPHDCDGSSNCGHGSAALDSVGQIGSLIGSIPPTVATPYPAGNQSIPAIDCSEGSDVFAPFRAVGDEEREAIVEGVRESTVKATEILQKIARGASIEDEEKEYLKRIGDKDSFKSVAGFLPYVSESQARTLWEGLLMKQRVDGVLAVYDDPVPRVKRNAAARFQHYQTSDMSFENFRQCQGLERKSSCENFDKRETQKRLDKAKKLKKDNDVADDAATSKEIDPAELKNKFPNIITMDLHEIYPSFKYEKPGDINLEIAYLKLRLEAIENAGQDCDPQDFDSSAYQSRMNWLVSDESSDDDDDDDSDDSSDLLAVVNAQNEMLQNILGMLMQQNAGLASGVAPWGQSMYGPVTGVAGMDWMNQMNQSMMDMQSNFFNAMMGMQSNMLNYTSQAQMTGFENQMMMQMYPQQSFFQQ